MSEGILSDLILMLVRRLPMLLLFLGGSIYAVGRWKRHPRVSLMVILASVVYLVEGPIFTAFVYQFPFLSRFLDLSSKGENWSYTAIYFFEDFLFAGIIVTLIAAAFYRPNTLSRGDYK